MLTEKEVAERVNFLGGSEIAAALGLSMWKTRLQLWSEKAAGIPPEDISQKMHVRVGNKLEQPVSELFEEDYNKRLHRVNEILVHPKYPFLRGRVDRRVVGEKAIVELKTTTPYNSWKWAEGEAPIDYQIQTMYYMALSGADRGYLVCLAGNQELFVKVIERDEKALSDIIEKAADFWNRFVIPKVMPGVSSRDGDVLNQLFPMGDEEAPLKLGDEANQLLDLLEGLKADAKSLENQKDKLENEIKVLIKDRQSAETDRWKIVYKNVISNRLDSKKMKKEDLDLYKKWSVESASRPMKVYEKS